MNWISVLLQIALVAGVIYWWIYQKQKDPNWKPGFMREKPEKVERAPRYEVRRESAEASDGQTNIFIKVGK